MKKQISFMAALIIVTSAGVLTSLAEESTIEESIPVVEQSSIMNSSAEVTNLPIVEQSITLGSSEDGINL